MFDIFTPTLFYFNILWSDWIEFTDKENFDIKYYIYRIIIDHKSWVLFSNNRGHSIV